MEDPQQQKLWVDLNRVARTPLASLVRIDVTFQWFNRRSPTHWVHWKVTPEQFREALRLSVPELESYIHKGDLFDKIILVKLTIEQFKRYKDRIEKAISSKHYVGSHSSKNDRHVMIHIDSITMEG